MVKVERSYPAPKSLEEEAKKLSGKYDRPDVIRQLREDFHDKCYICEMSNLQDPEVEHLLPHKNGQYRDRKFDWNNLFLSCGHCNKVKNQGKYDAGILDCCRTDPEKFIFFRLREGEMDISAAEGGDETILRTVMLLREIFESRKIGGMRDYKCEMRFRALNEEMNKLYDNLDKVRKNPDSKVVLRKLEAMLRRESAFAAFKRNYVRENSDAFPQLLPYIV